MKKILILDGYYIFFKSYYAFIKNPLVNSKGQETSVLFGFLSTLHLLLSYKNFDYVVLVLDKGKSFRHDLYPEYKANRSPTPPTLKHQIQFIISILDDLGIPSASKEGYEGDDLLASISLSAQSKGIYSYIYTSDKDLAQVVSDYIYLIHPSSKSHALCTLDKDGVINKWGVTPEQIIDYLSILGDTSDNIPGIKGVGAKGAVNLLSKYGNLENIYEHIQDISGATHKKLVDSKESAFLSKDLIRLKTDVQTDIEHFQLKSVNRNQLIDLLEDLEVYQPIKKYALKSSSKPTISLGDFKNSISDETLNSSLSPISNFKRRTISSLEDLLVFKKKVELKQSIIFDIETTSLDPLTTQLVCFGFAFEEDNSSYFLPIIHQEKDFFKEYFLILKDIMENSKIKKIGHNLKFEYNVLSQKGIKINNIHHDTMISQYLIDSSKSHYNLESLIEQYFHVTKKNFKEFSNKRDILSIPLEELKIYNLEDVEYTTLLYTRNKNLLSPNLLNILNTIEIPLIYTISHMEINGVCIHQDEFLKMKKDYTENIEKIEKDVQLLSGEEFNLNSPKQLQAVLFEKLGIPPLKKNKTGFSTDISVLEKLSKNYPICSLIVEYRTLSKLLNTYIAPLPTLIHPKTNRIHTNYNQSVASTGRLSSSQPNLQNIPIRGRRGQEIRHQFISPPHMKMCSFDYSQVELKVLAFMSKDEILLKAFQNKKDIHLKTAQSIYQKEEISKREREVGKLINFSVIYGVSAFSLAQELSISPSEAKNFIETYFKTYPNVEQYRNEIINFAQKYHYVETYYKRKRPIFNINSQNKIILEKEKRIAFNTVIQGTASDIIKIAMIEIYKEISSNNIQAQLVIQVHDELVFYIPENRVSIECPKIKNIMEAISPFSSLLEVDYSINDRWEK